MTIKTFPYNHYDLWDSELIRVAYDFSIKAKDWVLDIISVENQKPHGDLTQEYQPKTAFGKKLWEMRKKHIASGAKLLTWDQIIDMKSELRGGSEWEREKS